MERFLRKAVLVLVALVVVAIPLSAYAQTEERPIVPPVPNYSSSDFTGLEACHTPGQPPSSVRPCGQILTEQAAAARIAIDGDFVLTGDIWRCDNVSIGGEQQVSCTYYHPSNRTAHSVAPYGWGGTLRSFTDAGGNTSALEGSDDFIESAGDSAGEAIGGFVEGAASLAISTAAFFALQVANFFLGIAGTLFNWVVVKTVFQFSTLIGNSPGLLIAWGILRDIANMLLLFGFIFIGVAMILDLPGQTYSAKKTLPKLIIFAILMNFSLFAAEAIIDIANGFSTVVYNQANTNACQGMFTSAGTGAEQQTDCAINYGIAGHIMQSTGLSSVFSSSIHITDFSGAAVMVGLALFATIGAVVLFAASIMLITRAVVLTLLMVTAPLGFAGMAIPPLEKAGKDWWNRLIHQAFFAPILLLLIFISLKITDSLASAETRGSLAGALTSQDSSVMGIIMVFALVIGFLVMSLVAAKKFGAMGADFAVKSAGNFAFGGAGFVGRRTVGRASSRLAARVRTLPIGSTNARRRVSSFIRRGGQASFDPRTTRAAAAISAGLNLGKVGKDAQKGFEGEQAAAVKRRTEYADSLPDDKEREERLKEERTQLESDWIAVEKKILEDIRKKESAVQDIEKEEKKLRDELAEARAASGSALQRGDSQEVGRHTDNARIIEQKIDALSKQATAEKTALGDVEKIYAESKTDIDNKKGEYDRRIKEVIENNPKRRYAEELEKSSPLLSIAALGTDANREAAKKIRADLKKSKGEKTLEQLEQSIKKMNDGGGEKKGGIRT